MGGAISKLAHPGGCTYNFFGYVAYYTGTAYQVYSRYEYGYSQFYNFQLAGTQVSGWLLPFFYPSYL